jgi:hypothetical protein
MENARIKNKNAIKGMEVRNAYIFFIGKVSINGLKIVHFGNMAKKELLKREQKVFYLKLMCSSDFKESSGHMLFWQKIEFLRGFKRLPIKQNRRVATKTLKH